MTASPPDPARHPGGVGAPSDKGGQFATAVHPPADLSELVLDLHGPESDEEYNARGTYAYPPSTRSAKQLLAFVRDVDIPDFVLENVQRHYSATVARLRREFTDEYAEEYRKKATPEAFENYRNAWERFYRTEHPDHIPTGSVRSIVRAANVMRLSDQMQKEERRAVLDARMTLEDGTETTPREVWNRYAFTYIRDQLDGRRTPESLMVGELRRLGGKLDEGNEYLANVGFDGSARIQAEWDAGWRDRLVAEARNDPAARRRLARIDAEQARDLAVADRFLDRFRDGT